MSAESKQKILSAFVEFFQFTEPHLSMHYPVVFQYVQLLPALITHVYILYYST